MAINLKTGRALVVVAHPDDETIWMGGTILAHSNIAWTVFALCRKNDSDREYRFKSAVKILHARGIITNLEDDDDRLSIKNLSRSAERLILRGLPRRFFDYIFTHAKDGDYGNRRHQGVSRAVSNLIKTDKLQAKKAYYFAYEMYKSDKYAAPKKIADFEQKLSEPIYNKKVKIINNIYGFTPDSFEVRSCSKIEKFNTLL